ncbi:MAG: 2-oxo-4-hydroxy-4-carboxy-5-ureidoimidazoline decarboxylase [Orrella sp.]
MSPIEVLNRASLSQALKTLAGLYEHSDWIIQRALAYRPFVSVAALQHTLQKVVQQASQDEQLALIRAHPALIGKIKIDTSIAPDSQNEQSLIGLDRCSPAEYRSLDELNDAYNKKFGWPFILAVKGPRTKGLTRLQIIDALTRRLTSPSQTEFHECLLQIHRIAQLRLQERLDEPSIRGERVWDDCETLAQHSEAPDQLTVTFLSPAHRACARHIVSLFEAAGFDSTTIDALGNVVGRYAPKQQDAPYLLTGSHYDTVKNAGKYDGRLGIVVPIEVVRGLAQSGKRLPFGIEVIAFAAEEGVRFGTTFFGSSALAGCFQAQWLALRDSQGVALQDALKAAGLPGSLASVQALARDPKRYLGFVQIAIEQGAVLSHNGLALGIVNTFNASMRYQLRLIGQASHAWTTPMRERRDTVCAAAEITLALEALASQTAHCLASVVPYSALDYNLNTVPDVSQLSIDLRAPNNAKRDELTAQFKQALGQICQRRGIAYSLCEVSQTSAVSCDQTLQRLWATALTALGLPLWHLPSGADHEAMNMHKCMPQAMLFVRGESQGISHNPLESTTCEDMAMAVAAFDKFCDELALSLASMEIVHGKT